MIQFSNGGRLVQDVLELLRPPDSIERLYLDLETTSRDDDLDSLNPWYHCWVAGVALTWDEAQGAWYVPVGHRDAGWNLPRDAVIRWLRDVMGRSRTWVNHHVKYDSHALHNDLGVNFGGERVCTIVRSKVLDSDRAFRGGYGLDVLSREWLREDISVHELRLREHLGLNAKGKLERKDYGAVPADVMAEYACQDVLTNRRLDRYLAANMYDTAAPVIETETKLTSMLVDMERTGMLVRPDQLLVEKLHTLTEMLAIEKRLHERVGYPVLPTSSKDCFDVLCNHFGLPVVAWTEQEEDDEGCVTKESNPSFDKQAMAKYLVMVGAPHDVVADIARYRKLSTLKGLFIDTFLELGETLADSAYSRLHPTHNQCVRTGRMSCAKPNSQQQNYASKALILPGDGMSLMSFDASQIEFRCIAHYTCDEGVVRAYVEDPDVDFHQRVADMAGMTRRPAKTLNFSVAFGQGKKSTVEQMSMDSDVVSSIADAIEAMVASGELHPDGKQAMFQALARQKGEALFDTYHETFPNIRATARMAADTCRARGWVRNVRGRRRYLPQDHAHKAFNTLNQSSAADIIKERMVALHEHIRGTPVRLITQVHDELVLVAPTEVAEDPRTAAGITAVLEDVTCLKVPIRFRHGVSQRHWAEACTAEDKGGRGDRSVPLELVRQLREGGDPLRHLRTGA